MKYVSCTYQSTGKIATMTPEIPPITNWAGSAAAKERGGFITIRPRHRVAIQLKILIPVGTAIANDDSMKNASTTVDSGSANMWCAHTSMPRNAIATVDAATAL